MLVDDEVELKRKGTSPSPSTESVAKARRDVDGIIMNRSIIGSEKNYERQVAKEYHDKHRNDYRSTTLALKP